MSKVFQRTEKTAIQIKCLEDFYGKGMTSYGRDNFHARSLLQDACIQSGLSELQIKNWIDNKRRVKVSNKVKVNVRKPRGYDDFKSKYIQAAGSSKVKNFKDANSAWKELTPEEKMQYNNEANVKELPSFHVLPVHGQLKVIRETRKQIEALCEKLDSYGVDTIVMQVDWERSDSKVELYGSTSGTEFIRQNKSSVVYDFAAFCSPGLGRKEVFGLEKLRKEVTASLNSLFYAATSGKLTQVSYTKINLGIYQVHGLPEGIVFKPPSRCSRKELEVLKENMEFISFTAQAQPIIETSLALEEPIDLAINEPVTATTEIVAPPIKKKKVSETHEHDENELDEVCKSLELSQYVPNKNNIEITLKELYEKSAVSQYYIEHISDDRDKTGTTQYLVKWVGFRQETWEPEENIPIADLKLYYSKSK